MALVVKDRVRETSVTQGTGTFTLAGAVTGYQSFSAIGNGNTTYYTIYLQASNEWEVGIGTYTASGTTLSRDTILASSNGGAVVNFSAGTKDVFVTYPAGRSVYYDTATNVSLNALTVAGAFAANGGATLGDASGDALTINSSAVSTPNGLNFDSDTFVIDATNNRVGIGAASPATKLVVSGNNTGAANNTLRFVDTATNTTTDQQIGKIEFFSSDTSTPGASVKAYIGAFATDLSPEAYLAFATDTITGTPTERMRIDSSGNVGIGTNAPTWNLSVEDELVETYPPVGALPTAIASISNSDLTTDNTPSLLRFGARGTTTVFSTWFAGNTGGSSTNYSGAFVFGNRTASTTYTERMRITSAGNVGIGTDAPAAKLSVDGSAIFNDSGADADFRVESDNNTHMLFVDAGNDRVGFGTASPNTDVEISTTVDPILRLNNSTNTVTTGADIGEIQFYTNDASVNGTGVKAFVKTVAQAFGSAQGGADLVFGTAAYAVGDASEKMRIDKDGNVGIGTNAPTNKLTVDGNANVTGNTTLGDASTDTVTVNGYMAVGVAPDSRYKLQIGGTTTGGVSSYGALIVAAGDSSATTRITGVGSQPTTSASAYTSTDVEAFRALTIGKGAGSTITNAHGLKIEDQTQGTNNFGITSAVSSGSNKWNIYASGSAANYFAGNVLVGTTASLGTAGVQAAAVATDPFEGYRFGANANGPTVSLYKNRGATVGTNAVVVSGDELGTIAFRGYDGAAYRAGAFITGNVDGTPGASDMPGRLTFSTTADGAATPTERMRIDSTGALIAKPAAGTGAVFNEDGVDADFRVESDTNTHALFVEATNSNVKIGGSAERATTVGTNHLDIFNGTAPVGTLTNGISIYSAAGEAYVMDAAGNATLFSPHDSETNEWIFKSKHTPTGKVLKIDVEKLLRFVNDHFGLDAIQEFIEE